MHGIFNEGTIESMLIFAYLFKIHCVYIFTDLRTNNGVLFVDWLAIKQFAFALSILAKLIFAFHRHSLGINRRKLSV